MIRDPATAAAVHGALEWLALLAGAHYYAHLRRQAGLPSALAGSGFTVLAGLLAGAGLGNKAVFWIEQPALWAAHGGWAGFMRGGQSLVGGLLGGLIGVEMAKLWAGVRQSTGDLFVFPILLGIVIGRIGCFLAGLHDDTYGLPTELPWGVDFGDGIRRHPTPLYEIAFALLLWAALRHAAGPAVQTAAGFLSGLAAGGGWPQARALCLPVWAVRHPMGLPDRARPVPAAGRLPMETPAVSRKTRPYLFYDTTASVCSACRERVEAKILIKDERVYLEKWCPMHGFERVLISDDAGYYRQCREQWIKPPELPQRIATAMQRGCPWDCGLCPDHMQHACLTVLEITEHCNLRCPLCYAESGPERTRHRPLAEIERMLDTIVAAEGEPDVVQLSGGEPTLHPQFFEILASARARPIRHIMINTNGLRLARDPAFAARLAEEDRRGLEIYLQFDSLDDRVLRELRGADLARIHREALDRLNEYGLSTTLVATLKKGLNDGEIGDLIRFGLSQPCVRGVTFQPIEDAGRVENFEGTRHRLTVSEIRRKIAEQSGLFTLEDVVPVPCNPDTLAMAYALRLGDETVPLTRYLDRDILVGGAANTIAFERDPRLKETLFRLFSTNHSPEAQAGCLSELLCCLPRVEAPAELSYENVFRVLIVQFMDAANLDLRALKKSCVHIVQPDGRLIPFEAFNLFYRGR